MSIADAGLRATEAVLREPVSVWSDTAGFAFVVD